MISGSAGAKARAACVAHEPAQQAFRGLKLGAVVVGQTSALAVDPPPALEAPQPLVGDAQAGDPAARAAWLSGLKVEETLERRR